MESHSYQLYGTHISLEFLSHSKKFLDQRSSQEDVTLKEIQELYFEVTYTYSPGQINQSRPMVNTWIK